MQVHALVVSYEMALAEITELRRLEWGVMVIDEGHRLKNPSSRLYKVRWTRQARPACLPGLRSHSLLCNPRTLGLQSRRGAHEVALTGVVRAVSLRQLRLGGCMPFK